MRTDHPLVSSRSIQNMYIHVMVIAIQYTLGVEASALYEARLLVDRQTSW
jgi:hypothetical protein